MVHTQEKLERVFAVKETAMQLGGEKNDKKAIVMFARLALNPLRPLPEANGNFSW